MMAIKKPFKNKLKDLEQDTDFEPADDFFQQPGTTIEVEEEAVVGEATPAQTMSVSATGDETWIDTTSDGYEGQLAVDIYQDEKNLYLKSIIGGIRPEDIELHLNNDMITIKGRRMQPDADIDPENYYIQECYWGGFSRSIILPVDVLNDKVDAAIEHGVLLITMPKSKRPKNTRIPIKTK